MVNRKLLAILLILPVSALAQEIKCPKGYQPYANRCVTQRMADYISCVEASGGNRQEISEEVSEIGGQAVSSGMKASGSGTIIKASGGLILSKSAEKNLAKKLETRWFPKGMSECANVLDRVTLKEIKKEAIKTRQIQEQMLINQKEIRQQGQTMLQKQDVGVQLLLEKMNKIERSYHNDFLFKYPKG